MSASEIVQSGWNGKHQVPCVGRNTCQVVTSEREINCQLDLRRLESELRRLQQRMPRKRRDPHGQENQRHR